MATTTIRLDEALLRECKKYKVNVSEAARIGIEEMLRRKRILAASARLAKVGLKSDEPSEVTIRRMRDDRARSLASRHGLTDD